MNNKNTNCCIITIGDELLIGQVVDTNSHWIAQEVRKIGLRIKTKIAVGDTATDIVQALNNAKQDSKVIFITGGLGPTSDDITKNVLCDYFNTELVLHEPSLQRVCTLLEQIKMPLTDRNKEQAFVPKNCIPIYNSIGSAPGMWFNADGIIFIAMPGVPDEMKMMMTNTIIPQLGKQFNSIIIDKHLLIIGQYESFLADLLKDFENTLPSHITLAYLPNAFGFIRLRLSAYEQDVETIEKYFENLKKILADFIILTEDKSIVEIVAERLKKYNKTVSTAESCTGGYIAHLFTKMSGASAYFYGSVVCYHQSIKTQILHVSEKTINEKNIVSEEVAQEMLKGVLQQMKTDYAIAVTGLMENSTNLSQHTGIVCIAVGSVSNVVVKTFNFKGNRLKNIESTAQQALNMLLSLIDKDNSTS